MQHTIRVSESAERQIFGAAQWWRENRTAAPEAVAEELTRAFALLSSNPSVGSPCSHPDFPNLRRIYLRRIRYHLYYEFDPTAPAIDILAFWHSSRGADPPLNE